MRKQSIIAQDFSALFRKNNLQLSLCPSLRSSINQSSFLGAQTSYKIPTVTFFSHFAMLIVKIWCMYIFSQYHFIIFLFPSSNNLKLYKSTVIKCIWWRLVPNKVLIFYKLKFSLFKKNTCEIVQSRDLNFGTLHST